MRVPLSRLVVRRQRIGLLHRHLPARNLRLAIHLPAELHDQRHFILKHHPAVHVHLSQRNLFPPRSLRAQLHRRHLPTLRHKGLRYLLRHRTLGRPRLASLRQDLPVRLVQTERRTQDRLLRADELGLCASLR